MNTDVDNLDVGNIVVNGYNLRDLNVKLSIGLKFSNNDSLVHTLEQSL